MGPLVKLLKTVNTGNGFIDQTGTSYYPSCDLEEALYALLKDIPGVREIRLMPRPGSNPKVFIITSTKDIDLDHRLVQIMMQFDDIRPNTVVSYDIVPESSMQMIPASAIPVANARSVL